MAVGCVRTTVGVPVCVEHGGCEMTTVETLLVVEFEVVTTLEFEIELEVEIKLEVGLAIEVEVALLLVATQLQALGSRVPLHVDSALGRETEAKV
jgi:hypothetical protein